MKLIIYINEHWEEDPEYALFDLHENKILLKGDWYHDKISHKIAGYLRALRDFDVYSEPVNEMYINSEHEHYDLLDFYNEDE